MTIIGGTRVLNNIYFSRIGKHNQLSQCTFRPNLLDTCLRMTKAITSTCSRYDTTLILCFHLYSIGNSRRWCVLNNKPRSSFLRCKNYWVSAMEYLTCPTCTCNEFPSVDSDLHIHMFDVRLSMRWTPKLLNKILVNIKICHSAVISQCDYMKLY